MGNTFTRLFSKNILTLAFVWAASVLIAQAQPVISYPASPATYMQGTAIPTASVTNTGTAVTASHNASTITGDPNNGNQNVPADGPVATAAFGSISSTAVDLDGNIFVTDANANAVRMISASTGLVSTITAPGDFTQIWGIALDLQGNLYVANYANGPSEIKKLTKVSPGVYTISSFATAGLVNPQTLATDTQGNLYALNSNAHNILKYSATGGVPDGASVSVFHQYDNSTYLAGLAIDILGNVFTGVSYNRIEKITPAGVSSIYANGIYTDNDLAVDKAGNIYYGRYFDFQTQQTAGIRRLSPNGTVTLLYSPQQFSDYGGAFSIDNAGNLIFRQGQGATAVGKISNSGFYAQLPGLPQGLSIDENTGDITGTPIIAAAQTTYTIAASDGAHLVTTPFTVTVNQVPPVIANVTPAATGHTNPDIVFVTGSFFGTSSADLTSIKYGANGTENTAVNPVWDSQTQVHFLPTAPLAAGSTNKVTLTINSLSATSTATFRADVTPAITYASGPYNYTEGTAITIVTPAVTGDAPAGTYTLTTIAGKDGIDGNTIGNVSNALLSFPIGVTKDPQGNIYVADHNYNTVRKITPDGTITLLAGDPNVQGGTDGVGAGAGFNRPGGIVYHAGFIYLAERDAHLIRKIDVTTGAVTTLAGLNNNSGNVDGQGSAARFAAPWAIATDTHNNLFVADHDAATIRKIDIATGNVTTIAGTFQTAGRTDGVGTVALFNYPRGIAVDALDNVYVSDQNNQTIRKLVNNGGIYTVSTLAGSAGNAGEADGFGTAAKFDAPGAMAIDPDNNIYVVDLNARTLRKITSAGAVTTVAGMPYNGSGQDGIGTAATLNDVYNMEFDNSGNLLFPNGNSKTVRKVNISTYSVSPALPLGLTLNEATGTIGGTAIVAAPATDYHITASDGFSRSNTSTVNITVIQTQPVITSFSPATVNAQTPAEITITGNYFGNSLADVTSITYGPNGTGASGTNIKFDSPTQIRFTPGVLTAGSDYKVIVTVGSLASVASTATFHALVPPAITIAPTIAATQGVAISPVTPVNTGDPIVKSYTVSTIAGTPGIAGTADGTGAAAQFSFPIGSTVDAQGNIFVADYNNGNIRKVTPSGVVTIYAGDLVGNSGYTDDANPLNARFQNPIAVAVDAAHNLYVVDESNHRIRKIDGTTGAVTTLAGDGSSSHTDGQGTAASFTDPRDITIDAQGNLYVMDKGAAAIRKITPGGLVSTLAGNSGTAGFADGTGSAAKFSGSEGITIDQLGNIYVADTDNQRIRKVTSAGVVTTLSGNGISASVDGTLGTAQFAAPRRISADKFGNIYVWDINSRVIRKIAGNGMVTTITGINGTGGHADGAGASATFGDIWGITTDMQGNLIVTDGSENKTVRKVTISEYSIIPALPAGLAFDDATGAISGTSTATLAATNYTITASDGYNSSNATVNITVQPSPPPVLSYASATATYNQGTAITPNTLSNTGTAVNFGSTVSTYASTNGNRTGLDAPYGSAVDAQGNIYVADYYYAYITKIAPSSTPGGAPVVTNIAGDGGNASTDGIGPNSQFNTPVSVAVDSHDDIFVGELNGQKIRKIDHNTLQVTTLAGSNNGYQDGTGAAAAFGTIYQIATDANDNIYVADQGNGLIRKVTPAGVVTTFADPSDYPTGITVDAQGNVYATNGNNDIIKITPAGIITNYATGVSFNGVGFLTHDSFGNIYEVEGQTIVKIKPNGTFAAIAGTPGNYGYTDGDGTTATFQYNTGISIDAQNNLYVTSQYQNAVRKVALTGYYLAPVLPAGLVFDDHTGTISGTPTVVSAATNYTVTGVTPYNSATATVNIAISAALPPVLSYATTPVVYTQNIAITPNTITNNGAPVNFGSVVSTFNAPNGHYYGNAVDAQGNIYAANINNGQITKTTPQGATTVLAGQPQFAQPYGIAVAANGDVYVSDVTYNTIQKIAANGGAITTFAGTSGTTGNTNGVGTAASFNLPAQIAFDANGNLYVADQSNSAIRKILSDGTVSTFATLAGYTNGVTVDAQGNVYATVTSNSVVKITPAGVVSNFAAGGPVQNINFLTHDSYGNIYVSKYDGIAKIHPDGSAITVAGNNTTSAGYVDGDGASAMFNNVYGISIDQNNVLYADDINNQKIRKVVLTGYFISPNLIEGLTFDDVTGTISGTPTSFAAATDYTVTGFTPFNSASATVNITVNNAQPVIANVSPLYVSGSNPGEITLTGQYFGRNVNDITSVTYGPTGTGASGTNIKYDSANQIRFTPGALTPGTSYQIIVTVVNTASVASTQSFKAAVPPVIAYTPNTLTLLQGTPITTPVTPTNTGDAITANSITTTVAGIPGQGGVTNGTSNTAFQTPTADVFDQQGNLYIADFDNNVIRKITPGGIVSTFAGTAGVRATTDGPLLSAAFNGPHGITIDANGNLYVAEAVGNTIRKINVGTGIVSTFAGSTTNTAGSDDGLGTLATLNNPLDVYAAADGNIYVADAGNQTIRKITQAGLVSTFAGQNGNAGYSDGTTTTAMFNRPDGLTMDSHGNLFVSDYNNGAVRKITPAGVISTLVNGFGNITKITIDSRDNLFVADFSNNRIHKVTPFGLETTVAGTQGAGYADGDVSTSQFNGLFGIAINQAGSLYTTEIYNQTIRKVTVSGFDISAKLPLGLTFDSNSGTIAGTPVRAITATTYNVTASNGFDTSTTPITITVNMPPPPAITYANNTQAYPIGVAISSFTPTNTGSAITGLNAVSTLANGFNRPQDIVKDANGNIYLADAGAAVIRKITADGTSTVFAGTVNVQGNADGLGTAAQFYTPQGLAIDAQGNLYVSDGDNQNIRKVTPAGLVTTFAGDGNYGFADGAAATAEFQNPRGLAFDANGNLYVADSENELIRKITPLGDVSTFAGTTQNGGSADGTGTAATFSTPWGLAFDPQGNLIVTDRNNQLIRKITSAGVVSTLQINGPEGIYGPEGITIDNQGNYYVINNDNSNLVRVSPTGYTTLVAGGNYGNQDGNNADAQFGEVTGVAFDGTGTLYVTDSDYGTIRNIALNNYSINARLPDGLMFDQVTGTISGTPTIGSPANDYMVIATNLGGVSTATINIAVTLPAAPIIAYNPATVIFKANTAIAAYTPTNTGSAAVTGGSYVSTLAGNGNEDETEGTGTSASLARPSSVATDKQGNIYVVDEDYNLVRKITAAGVVTTIAGSVDRYGNDDGDGLTAASFSDLRGVAIDPQGNIYVSDGDNDGYNPSIRKLTPNGASYTVSTIANTGNIYSYPRGLVSDAQGNIYIADQSNYKVLKLTPAGVLSVYAGTGARGNTDGTATAATFSNPSGITVDAQNNIYVSQNRNRSYRIRKITPAGVVSTFAGSSNGSADGTGTAASFNQPYSLTADSLGNVYVADLGNKLIRKITSAGVVSTIAGVNGNAGTTNGLGTVALFNNPIGVAIDGANNLYVADQNNNLIRKVAVNGFTINKTLPAGLTFNADNGTITGTPTTVAAAKSIAVTATNYGGSSTANISIAISLPAPTVQASALTFAATTGTSTTVSWTNGNGAARVVFVKATTTDTPLPTDNTTYTANTAFGSGTQIGTTGWYAVYNGSGNSVTITGLTGGTTYSVMTQEYAGTADSESYATVTATGNPANVTTLGVNAALSNLTISAGTLSPAFASGTTNYTASVSNAVTSVTIMPTVTDANSTISVNGTTVASGSASQPVALNAGNNTITTVVTAQDGITKTTYTVVVNRADGSLSNLVLSAGALTPAFAPGTTSYTLAAANTVTNTTVTPTATDAAATITVNGTAVANGTASQAIPLAIGNNTITTVVTASDGVTQITYTVNVTRAISPNRTIAFAALPVKTFGNADFAASATISSGETPIYTSSNTAVATIVNGNIHIVGAGTTTITAAAPVNANYNATTPVSLPLIVNKADQIITFNTIPSQTKGTTYSLAGVTSSIGAAVTFTSSDASVATVSGTTLTSVGLGSANITALAAGTANYNAALTVIQQVRVISADGEPIIVHQGLSPNGDGINDVLQIEGIKDHPNNKVTVMTRNGVKVFEIKGYDNSSRGFDGHSNITGAALQQGTYFYLIEYTDENGLGRRKTGFFVYKF